MKEIKLDINVFLYIIYLLIYVVTVSLYVFGNSISNFRYYFLFLLCIIGFFVIILAKRKSYKLINKSFLVSIIVAFFFLLFSYTSSLSVGIAVPFRTYVQISLFLFPTLYAFYISNFLSLDNIIKMMKITTIFLIVAYFFDKTEPNHHILNFFNIKNWLSIDYLKSNSFTESHNWSESFLQLFIFFYYFYKKISDNNLKKKLKPYMIITMIFTLLCFKRLSILIVLFFLFFGNKIMKKDSKKAYYIILTFFFVVSTIIYTKFMKNEIFDYNTVFRLTTGRNWILKMWEYRNYISFGYGSSMLVIGRYLEMDLVQIYLELNLFCLFLFIYCYFNISKNNLYCLFITFFAFINMLTASSLPWQISWVVMMLNIAAILKYENEIKKNNNYNGKEC